MKNDMKNDMTNDMINDMINDMTNDMTKGSPIKLILLFSIPLLNMEHRRTSPIPTSPTSALTYSATWFVPCGRRSSLSSRRQEWLLTRPILQPGWVLMYSSTVSQPEPIMTIALSSFGVPTYSTGL